MKHVEIKAICNGDRITAISNTLELCKAWGNPMYLEFKEGYEIKIHPDSNVYDLISIMKLKHIVETKPTENLE